MALATDVENMLQDPISKFSYNNFLLPWQYRFGWNWNGQNGCHEGIQ